MDCAFQADGGVGANSAAGDSHEGVWVGCEGRALPKHLRRPVAKEVLISHLLARRYSDILRPSHLKSFLCQTVYDITL